MLKLKSKLGHPSTIITVYADKSFTFITKSPPASDLLKKAAKLKKGSQTPGTAVADQ